MGDLSWRVFRGFVGAEFLVSFIHLSLDDLIPGWPPFLGAQAEGFLRHHFAPRMLAEQPFPDSIAGATLVATLPLALLSLSAMQGISSPGFEVDLFSLLSFSVLSFEFHKWAHGGGPQQGLLAWLIRRAQNGFVAISKSAHTVHHTDPNSLAHGTISGWSNPIMDRTGFYRGLLQAYFWVFGRMPNSWKLGPELIPAWAWARLARRPQLVPWEWEVIEDGEGGMPRHPLGVKLWDKHLRSTLSRRPEVAARFAPQLLAWMERRGDIGTRRARELLRQFVERMAASTPRAAPEGL
jgi:hypothetical protein